MWSPEDFKRDVYYALADVAFKWSDYIDQHHMDLAYDWFTTHFWDSDDWMDYDENYMIPDYQIVD